MNQSLGRYFALFAVIGGATLSTFGCAVDASDSEQGPQDNAEAAPAVRIQPITDAERFPAPMDGDGEKACGADRADFTSSGSDITWLDWGPFPNSGNFGWQSCVHWCPAGSYAYSVQVRSEASLGGGDDTAMNGIAMDCYHKFPDINGNAVYTGTITSAVGPWGNWGTRPVCPWLSTPLVSGRAVNLEGSQGSGDDTALNKITATCSNGTLLQPSSATSWGVSVAPDDPCKPGTAICGIKTQLEGNQGSGDDTSLNGAVFYCCAF